MAVEVVDVEISECRKLKIRKTKRNLLQEKTNYRCQQKFDVLRDETCTFKSFLLILLLFHLRQENIRVYDFFFIFTCWNAECAKIKNSSIKTYSFVFYYCYVCKYIYPVVQLGLEECTSIYYLPIHKHIRKRRRDESCENASYRRFEKLMAKSFEGVLPFLIRN